VSDRHIRRSGSDYTDAFLSMLPQGQAWPKHAPGSVLVQGITGLCDYWGYVDGRAADLLEIESDPRTTFELLPDWERNWGLPDPCYTAPLTIGERQQALVMRMTMEGAQSRAFFIDVAEQIGYTITISEYRVFVVGIDGCGDCRVYGDGTNPMMDAWNKPIVDPSGSPVAKGELSEWPNYGIGPPSNRFYWTVHVTGMKLTWFRVGGGGGQTGVDPHLRIGLADDLECLLNRWKPAHTIIIFDYSEQQAPTDTYIWFRVSASFCGIDPHLTIITPGTAPFEILLDWTSVVRDAPIGTVVGNLTVPNSHGTVFYMADSAGGRFAISEDTLVTAAAFSGETVASYDVRIGATSPMIPPYFRFTITITDP
jgi:uncharacterized protein YmfQ (DUF2313 family)